MSGPTRVPAGRGCRLAPAPWSGRPAEQQRRPQLQTGSNGDQAAGGGAPPPGPPSLPPRAAEGGARAAPLGGGWAACKTRFSPLENGASTARPPKAAGEKALGPPRSFGRGQVLGRTPGRSDSRIRLTDCASLQTAPHLHPRVSEQTPASPPLPTAMSLPQGWEGLLPGGPRRPESQALTDWGASGWTGHCV